METKDRIYIHGIRVMYMNCNLYVIVLIICYFFLFFFVIIFSRFALYNFF
jgi:hypothetical protein